ncbi:helix-turn-helix domain-containing protein [Levilactobacillus suantsaiihabitans]|nr:helix-turn-helix transcriptional regulator [Levilactobacillus suantsaiihabitans]
MSRIDDFIRQQSAASPEFAAAAVQTSLNLETAVAVLQLRTEQNLTRAAFARQIGLSLPTLTRLEAGDIDVSLSLLKQIATATHKQLSIKFT